MGRELPVAVRVAFYAWLLVGLALADLLTDGALATFAVLGGFLLIVLPLCVRFCHRGRTSLQGSRRVKDRAAGDRDRPPRKRTGAWGRAAFDPGTVSPDRGREVALTADARTSLLGLDPLGPASRSVQRPRAGLRRPERQRPRRREPPREKPTSRSTAGAAKRAWAPPASPGGASEPRIARRSLRRRELD